MNMSAEFEKIESLIPDFQYVDRDKDQVIVTVGFKATFYFWNGHTPEKRLALVECIEAYEVAYGDQLTWACDPDSWKPTKLSKHTIPSIRDYVKPLDQDDAIEWYVSSGDDPEAVGEYAISCMTERGWQQGYVSCLQFHVPREHAFDSEKLKVLESLLAVCVECLTPFHGSAGLAAVTVEQGLTWEPELLDLATRYRSIQVEDIVRDRKHATNGLKSVNWLTFVGDALSERLGGPKTFPAYCRLFGVEPGRTSNGFVIRAGALPQLGPLDEPVPEAYVRVNAALRPLRNGNYGSMGSGSVNGELRFTRVTSDLWIRRFDAPDIWPPKSFALLGRHLVGKLPEKVIKLKTGEKCVVHGRYRQHPVKPLLPDEEEYNEDPTVVLLPGDLAPFLLRLGAHGKILSCEPITWAVAAEL
jgi:hypothetical protein